MDRNWIVEVELSLKEKEAKVKLVVKEIQWQKDKEVEVEKIAIEIVVNMQRLLQNSHEIEKMIEFVDWNVNYVYMCYYDAWYD